MGVFNFEKEITTAIPPAKMYKAFVVDADTLFPKVVPHAIKSVELLEGDGGAGTIKKVTFGEGSQFKYMKHKVEGKDKENFTYRYSIIEGDVLMNALEKISYEIKFVAAPDGGSICKITGKYYTIGNIEIKEEQFKAGEEKDLAMYRAVEAYLLANPDAC